jgi:hypothetical protein
MTIRFSTSSTRSRLDPSAAVTETKEGVAMLEWFVPPIVIPLLALVLIGAAVAYHALA